MFVAFLLLPDFITLFFVGLVGMALSYLFSQQLHKANTWVFKRLKNESKIPDLEESFPKGGPWDEHLIAITVHPLSSAVEKTLIELDLRNQFGVNVIFHQRADRRVVAPPGDTRLYPSDVLLLMGSEESLSIVERLLSSNHCLERTEEIQEKFIIHSARIEPDSAWDGKELGDLDIQNTLRAVIVAIEQNQDQKIITPAAHTKIEKGDLVWLAMDKSRLDLLDLFVRAIPT
jgi:CPA2 family monovalent cation:H+ antiporter-2